ncbi:hypothetical protein ACIBBB_27700 [Streptomyces sp. NPDC051217]|uniref:hypothetical protein n=1 Tax=Streptomyces sp. NPDC051217 TaxID=3365644 RepID=UPI0037973DCF
MEADLKRLISFVSPSSMSTSVVGLKLHLSALGAFFFPARAPPKIASKALGT